MEPRVFANGITSELKTQGRIKHIDSIWSTLWSQIQPIIRVWGLWCTPWRIQKCPISDGKETVRISHTTKLEDRRRRSRIRILHSLEEILHSALHLSQMLPARLFNQAMTVMGKTITVSLSSTQQNTITTAFISRTATHILTQTSVSSWTKRAHFRIRTKLEKQCFARVSRATMLICWSSLILRVSLKR